jgi:copper transport protein
MILPQTVSAHASLVQANPEQGSRLSKSPHKVVLTFNERLDGQLYKLRVYDRNGKPVTEHQAKLSKKHRKLSLKLPPLDSGIYTVTYKVISADGHPVGSTYTFSVGHVSGAEAANRIENDSGMDGHDHSATTFIVRIAYYLALLFVTGWTIWGMVSRQSSGQPEEDHHRVSKFLKQMYLFFLLGFGFIEFASLLGGLGGNRWVALFTSSAVGLSWLISLVLAVAGFWILGRSKWIDGAWVIILLAAEAFNGHALAFHPVVLTILLDFLHLLTAAVWSGGLLYLIYFWKKDPEHAKRFLPMFSKAALVSLILLVITGTLNTWLFLPALRDVLVTWWGKLLLVKTALVVVVILTAAFIRSAMKKRDGEKIGRRVKTDFTVMILIVVIVGVFTYLNPIPENKPLVWQVSKHHLTVTTIIKPKLPQTENTYTVKVRASAKPNEVKLELRDEDNEKVTPIKAPLKFAGHEGNTYIYQTKKGYIPFPGKWQITIRILDEKDNFTKLQRDVTIYPTST